MVRLIGPGGQKFTAAPGREAQFFISKGFRPVSGPPTSPAPIIQSATEAFMAGTTPAIPAGVGTPAKPAGQTFTASTASTAPSPAAPAPRTAPLPPEVFVPITAPPEPPPMRTDIGTAIVEPFVAEPPSIFKLSRPTPETTLPIFEPVKEFGPEPSQALRFQETVTPQFEAYREEVKGEIFEDPAKGIFETFEFLVPKRTEREIAFGAPETTLGFRPVFEFGAGALYGAATLPAAIISLPKTAVEIATRPSEVFKAVVGKAAKYPTFFLGEIAGQTLAGYGLGKLAGFGISRIRARGITTELVAGEYTYMDIAGRRIGLAKAKAVLLKKKKPIAKFDIETIFKPAKTGEVSPAISRIMVTEPKPMRLFAAGKGITYPEVSGFYPGISKVILFEKGKPISAAAAAGITKVEPGILKTAGISITAPPKAKAVFGAIFREVKLPSPTTFIKAAPKPIIKPSVPAVVTTMKAITKATGKVITKTGPMITRTGALTGAISAFVGARRAPAILEEEELYVSPRAAEVVGVKPTISQSSLQRVGLGKRQIEESMQKVGVSERQTEDTLSKLGIKQATKMIQKPAVGFAVGLGVIQKQRVKPMQIQKVALKPAQKMKTRFRMAMPKFALPTPAPKAFVPPIIPELDVLRPARRKKRIKKFKYRKIKHPFPTIRQLLGFKI